jgi:flavin reductase (DIM6/NTAB) family NADH-FMN oxidoreductase RutF
VSADAPDVTASAAAPMARRLDYPMFVVTASDGEETSGCLAGFVTQCSIVPTRFFVCVSKENHTSPVAERAPALGLHLLGADQHDLAAVFGELTGDDTDKLALVSWHRGPAGCAVLDQCAAWIEGRVLERVDVGDHVGYVVEAVAGGEGPHAGQLSYSAVRDLEAGHPPGET